ncbi:MAG: TIGR03943 family protein [Pleurocapsa minor GSE-CHR-MK-17-07R]|jgi:uncharacterized repeat protein (TIGR03943 family)|nr:TIGR03943 family protein [Pleurocapsa minor GSE-CHR-MK 17-07R]
MDSLSLPKNDLFGQMDADAAFRKQRTMALARAFVLLGLGAYFAWNIVSGSLANYINASFAWLSYVASGLFLLMGAFALLRARAMKPSANGLEDLLQGNSYRAPVSWGVIALVAVPLLLGTLIPSRPLGAEAVTGIDMSAVQGASSGSVTTFTIAPLNRNVLDWLRVFNATTDYAALNGEPADVIGFVYVEPDMAETQFMVARFTVSCCVADSNAIGVPVHWGAEDVAALPQGQWVRVTGTMQVESFRGDDMPVLQASAVELIEAPSNPYLFP